MAINPDGTITITYPPIQEKANGEKVRADHVGQDFDDIINGINAQIDRYGRKSIMSDINFNNRKILNLASPTSASDGVNKGYVDNQIDTIKARQATTLQSGLIRIATNEEAVMGQDNSIAITPATLNKVLQETIIDVNRQLPYNYHSGYICSNSGTSDPTRIIRIETGQCKDALNQIDMVLEQPITKRIDQTWTEGNNVGGLGYSISLQPNSTYNIFAIGSQPIDATSGKFTTPDISGNISALQQVGDGYLRVVVDGVNQDMHGLNFNGITDLQGIALILNNALAGVIVSANTTSITFTSATNGNSSSINISSIPGGSGTDLSLANYLNAAEGIITNGTNFVKSKIDVGFDLGDVTNASNILNQNGPAYQAGYRYYKQIGVFTTDSNSNISLCYEVNNSLLTNINNITPSGVERLQKLISPDYNNPISIPNGAGSTYTCATYGTIVGTVTGNNNNPQLLIKKTNSSGSILGAASIADATQTHNQSFSFRVYPGLVLFIQTRQGATSLNFYKDLL